MLTVLMPFVGAVSLTLGGTRLELILENTGRRTQRVFPLQTTDFSTIPTFSPPRVLLMFYAVQVPAPG